MTTSVLSMTKSAAARFEQAKIALASLDFRAAARHAEEAEPIAWRDAQVSDYGAPANPIYSIIIVLYQRHSDLAEALGRLSRYSDDPDFELIFVNNGDFTPEEIGGYCPKFRWVDVGFNYGCSGGRNLGARAARGEFMIFIDDDGLIEERAIEQLINTVAENDALAVRGRVRPKSKRSQELPRTYDLGEEIVYSVPNAEGISIWQRRAFLDHGGFDTLLAGREGPALWSRIYDTFPDGAFLYTPKAILLHDFSIDTEKSAIRKARENRNTLYFNFAYPKVQEKRWAAALEYTKRVAGTDTENSRIQLLLGNLLQKTGKLEEAEVAHSRVIELEPGSSEAHHQLSVIYGKQGRANEALSAARRAMECDPKNAVLHYHLGRLLQGKGRLVDAEVAYRRAIEIDPHFAKAHWRLSRTLYRQHRHDEALAATRRAVEIEPDNIKFNQQLTKLLRSLEHIDAEGRQTIGDESDSSAATAGSRLIQLCRRMLMRI